MVTGVFAAESFWGRSVEVSEVFAVVDGMRRLASILAEGAKMVGEGETEDLLVLPVPSERAVVVCASLL